MTDFKIKSDALSAFLSDLIKINSVNPSLSSKGKGEAEIARYIGEYLRSLGLEVIYQDIKKNRMNVIGILKGTGGGKSIMLNGHTDTVSAERMEIEPFNPVIDGGKIFGRGALDMKSGLTAQIMAVQSIIESNIKLNGDIILALVADEEYASLGTETIIKKYSADAAIICEPTNLDIVIAHKGFAWTKIEIFGKAAHGSMPDRGIDAIVKAGKVLTEIERLGELYLIQKKHPLLDSPSIHASLINGGIELSTYPDYCKIELERRTLPHEDVKIVTEEIKRILEDIKLRDRNFNAKFEVFFSRPAFEISIENQIVQSLSRAFQKILNKKPKYKGMGGWIDSALLAEAGIPAVIFGPSGEGLHASIEYVDLESIIITAKILTELIADFCSH